MPSNALHKTHLLFFFDRDVDRATQGREDYDMPPRGFISISLVLHNNNKLTVNMSRSRHHGLAALIADF